MSELFLKIVNMSISAGWVVVAVLIMRIILRKAPKWIRVLMWGIVAVRLVCPFTVESVVSLIPSAQTLSPDIMMDPTPTVHTGVTVINNSVNPIITGSLSPSIGDSVNPLQIWIPILSAVWLLGIAVLLVYTLISYIRLRLRLRTAVLLRDNVFESDNVSSPFVLGVIKPRIYLPFNINKQDAEHVIAHEQAHVRRRDHLWKPLGFLLLTVHWFNPLMWLAYLLLCRDIELACDEKVVNTLDLEQRADYSEALLNCSVNRRTIAACPLAFGEVGVKNRVKSVLSYKKPALWIMIIAVAVSIVAAVCFLTDPKEPDVAKGTDVSETDGTDPVDENDKQISYTDSYIEDSPVIDRATYDIDGDGKVEECCLRVGPTYGRFTFSFSAYEDGEVEYYNLFCTVPLDLNFEENIDGTVVLRGETDGKVYYADTDVDNGYIILFGDNDIWYQK